MSEHIKKTCGRCNKPKGEGEGFCKCGRPVKYTTDAEMVAKVEEYIESCVDEYDADTKQRKVRLPKIASLALRLGVSKETVNQWERLHPQFSEAVDKVRALQEERLSDEGLAGNYNPLLAKLHLAANHGMADKVDQDIKSNGETLQGVAVQFVDAKKDE